MGPSRTVEAGTVVEQEALRVATKMAHALAYLHERGVVHRDVKPANILFNNEGEPVLSDFGIAKAFETDSHLTQTGMVIGSERYMSPEQLRGERIGPASDVFSLVLVFMEMLVGAIPSHVDDRPSDRLNGRLRRYAELVDAGLQGAPEKRPTPKNSPRCWMI